MTMDVIYEELGSHWSHQFSVVAAAWWLQWDQILPLSVKGEAFVVYLYLYDIISRSPQCG